MKKIYISLFSALATVSCVLQTFSPNATPAPIVTNTDTSTPPPTFTPVPPTPTFTFTPTLSAGHTSTATPQVTFTASVSNVTPLIFFTPLTPTEIFSMKGFVFVNISAAQIFKGKACQPSFVKITAQAGLNDTAHVLLFARFKSLQSERTSTWTTIEMQTIGAGTYIHDLYVDEMREDQLFQTAWVEYQIVATNSAGKEIGRTDIFKEKVKMIACVPPTPTFKP